LIYDTQEPNKKANRFSDPKTGQKNGCLKIGNITFLGVGFSGLKFLDRLIILFSKLLLLKRSFVGG